MNGRVSRRQLLATAAAAATVAIAAGCSLQPTAIGGATLKKPKSMTFMAGYKPQANVSFVGVYVAHDLGYFTEQGLDVTIKHSTGQGEEAKYLAAKQIEVITETAADLIKNRTGEGVPFVSLAVLTQTSDTAMVSLKTSGIDDPKKFEGKTVGYKVYPTFEYLAMLKASNVDRSKISEVSVGFDPRILTQGKVDVLPVFKSNEPDILQKLGFPLNILDPATYGVQSMGQIWVTHQDLLTSEPDVYERWVKSALKGLAYAFANPKEAIDIVMRYAPTEDRSHQEFMLATEEKSAVTEQTRSLGLGWQTLDQWTRLQNGMADFGLIKSKVDPATLFTEAIEKNIYRNGQLVWP